MTATNTASKLATLASALVLLQGCATAPIEPAISEQPDTSEIVHRVRPHERLGDIALQYTGNATNWQKIAQYNGISNPRHLRIGAMIAIPDSWVAQGRSRINTPDTTGENLQLAPSPRPHGNTTTNTLAIKRSTPQESADVVLNPVTTNRSFELNPINEPTPIKHTSGRAPAANVLVVGSYYPKGVYSQPVNYSPLMMRATPGTLFELEYLANDWYRVITEKGVGYLRKDDGKVVPPGPTSQTTIP